MLRDVIADIHNQSRGTYVTRRIKAALEIERGIVVNKKLVNRIMAELGISGLQTRKTVKRNLVNAITNEDLLKRNFIASRPNQIWPTDITEHPTREGKL